MRIVYRLGEFVAVFLVLFFILHGFVSWPWAAVIGLVLATLKWLWPYLWARLVLLKEWVFG